MRISYEDIGSRGACNAGMYKFYKIARKHGDGKHVRTSKKRCKKLRNISESQWCWLANHLFTAKDYVKYSKQSEKIWEKYRNRLDNALEEKECTRIYDKLRVKHAAAFAKIAKKYKRPAPYLETTYGATR